MTKENTLSRRGLLKLGGVSALAVGASRVLNADVCALTPAQDKGPFYPVADQSDKNTDLTQVNGRRGKATGTVIHVSGKVVDQGCLPVAGVTVEIWQACQSGRYNHPRDPNRNGILDPNFQYWGIDVSKADGTYGFTTIVPGHYPAGANWTRPPHIHFKVHKLGIQELITQMYFLGNRYNDADLILNAIPKNERESVVRPMIARPGTTEFDVKFDISVNRLV